MTVLVSILVPAYNAGPWIAETLNSALAQTWPSTEVIVVNDGSTDTTLAIAKGFEDRGITVVSQRNSGASAARNRALSLARGDYIQWLDADDLLAPDKIQRQMQAREAGASDLVLLSSAFGEFFADPGKARFAAHSLWQDMAPKDFLLRKFIENVWMNPAAWLVSRQIAMAAGPWDERLSLDDDGEYFTRVVAASTRVKFVAESRSFYRRGHVGSLSRSTSDQACDSLLLSLDLCIKHLRLLEDSEHTRAASITLLQNWVDLSDCFYPDQSDRLRRLQQLGHELGGTIRAPRLSWKYTPIQRMFGWGVAKRAKATVSNMKLLARLQLDRLTLTAPGRKPAGQSSGNSLP